LPVTNVLWVWCVRADFTKNNLPSIVEAKLDVLLQEWIGKYMDQIIAAPGVFNNV